MKITQTIEVELNDKKIILTVEEAEKLFAELEKILRPRIDQEKIWKKLSEEAEKPIPQQVYPHYPYEPIWPPIQPWPSTQPIWCGQVTLDTNTNINKS